MNRISPLQIYKLLLKHFLTEVFSNLTLRLCVCFPVFNCTTERSFSCLKLMKNYSRSTMDTEILNSLAIMNIEVNLRSTNASIKKTWKK